MIPSFNFVHHCSSTKQSSFVEGTVPASKLLFSILYHNSKWQVYAFQCAIIWLAYACAEGLLGLLF